MRPFYFFLVMYSMIFLDLNAQTKLSDDPENAEFITSDIPRFWRSFDAAKGKPLEEQIRIYQNHYIDSATIGFKSWIEKRGNTTEGLVEGVNTMLPFYESIRENSLNVESYEKEIRAGFYALKHLYQKARFPDVYFFIWFFFNSGSTTTDEGLMITIETRSIDEDTPLDKFPEVHRKMIASMNLTGLAAVAVHESIHEQQKDYETKNLLEKAVREGTADFIAELCTGRNPSIAVHEYANPKEEDLWKEFQGRMNGKDYSGWTGIPYDRPAGLAYWMGYKIVEAYYAKQKDKKSAVKFLIETTDYRRVLRESGYGQRFK